MNDSEKFSFTFHLFWFSLKKTWKFSLFYPHLTRSSNKYITRVVYGCWNENSKEKLKHHSILLSFCERKGKLSSSSQLRGGEKDKEEEEKMIFLVTRKGKIGNCVFCVKKALNIFSHPSLSLAILFLEHFIVVDDVACNVLNIHIVSILNCFWHFWVVTYKHVYIIILCHSIKKNIDGLNLSAFYCHMLKRYKEIISMSWKFWRVRVLIKLK